MIEIETVEPDRWPQLREIRLTALQDSPDAFGSTYERERAFDEATWRSRAARGSAFFAVDDGRPIGMASGYADPERPSHERCLVAMWVEPASRGQGISRRLIDAVAHWARDSGASVLRLEVALTNPAARSTYLRAGFEPTGEIGSLPRHPSVLEESMTLTL